MRKNLLFSAVLIIIFSTGIFPHTWGKINSGSYENFYGIYFLNNSTGIGACQNGVVYKTTDGGASWKEKFNNLDVGNLRKIQFVNKNLGFIAGSNNFILKTIDAGETWSSILTDTGKADIKSVHFSDEQTGWILTDKGVKHTIDGGITWTSVLATTVTMNDMVFDKNSHAIVSGKSVGDIYFSPDGITWTKTQAPTLGGIPYSRSDIKSVFIVNNNLAYAVGWGSLIGTQPSIYLKTTDGGASWTYQMQASENITYETLTSVCFRDSLNGIAVGGGVRSSIIVKTTDGGKNWKRQNVYSGVNLYSVFSSGDTVWAAGNGGMVMRSIDFGTTWELQTKFPASNLNNIQFTSTSIGYAAGENGTFFKTTDGGKTWGNSYVYSNSISPHVLDFVFLNDSVGYTAQGYKMISKTTNGGQSWSAVIKDTTDVAQNFYGINFINEKYGFAVGKAGTKIDIICKTTDGGINWETKTKVLNANLRDVALFDEKRGVVVGEGLKAGYTTDGGASWTASKFNNIPSTEATALLKSVFCLGNKSAIAVGYIIVKSTDGGATWDYIDVSKFSATYTNVVFLDSLKGYAIGNNNISKVTVILETLDGGSTWNNILNSNEIPTPDILYGVAFDKSGSLWAAGSESSIYTNNPTITGVRNNELIIPAEFKLSQNYPNPFNPSTKISYEIQHSSKVTLKVYDILGRMVQILVDEFQTAGRHEIVFNGKNLASGIYFYSLNVDGISGTKRMVLMK